MRRFRNGATQRPVFKRPGIAYGQYCSGAPGPTRQIKPCLDIVPEMFIENSEHFFEFSSFLNNKVKIDSPELEKIKSKTIIDLREFH